MMRPRERARLVLVVWPLFFFLFAYADAITAILYPDNYSRTAWVFRVFLLALPLRQQEMHDRRGE